MTEQDLTREIDAIASSLPEIPSPYSELRSLIAGLPGPTLPDLLAARTGQSQVQSGATNFGSADSPLSGDPIGQDSGAALGVVSQLFYGRANHLKDPTLEQLTPVALIPITVPGGVALDEWQSWYLLNSGTAPTVRGINLTPRTGGAFGANGSAANSAVANVHLGTFPGAGSVDVFFQHRTACLPATWPYLVGAFRLVLPNVGQNPTNLTSLTVWTELVDGAGTVLASSTPFDYNRFIANSPILSTKVLAARLLAPAAVNTFVRLRIRAVASAAGPDITIGVSEPQLAAASTEQPPPFAPIITAWVPGTLEALPDAGGYIRSRRTAGGGLADFFVGAPGDTVISNGMLDTRAASMIRLPLNLVALPTGAGSGGETKYTGNADPATGARVVVSDSQRERNVTVDGWAPFADFYGHDSTKTVVAAVTLPAAGGSIAVPVFVPGHLLLHSITIRNFDVATARSWEGQLYRERLNGGIGTAGEITLDAVVGAYVSEAFTPVAAANHTAATAGAVYLGPGAYWLVIRNTHATSTFILGGLAAGTMNLSVTQTKTIAAALGATLDFVTTWVKGGAIISGRLNGRVFGQVANF